MWACASQLSNPYNYWSSDYQNHRIDSLPALIAQTSRKVESVTSFGFTYGRFSWTARILIAYDPHLMCCKYSLCKINRLDTSLALWLLISKKNSTIYFTKCDWNVYWNILKQLLTKHFFKVYTSLPLESTGRYHCIYTKWANWTRVRMHSDHHRMHRHRNTPAAQFLISVPKLPH